MMNIEEATKKFEAAKTNQDVKLHDLELNTIQRSNSEMLKIIENITGKIVQLCEQLKIKSIDPKDIRRILEESYNDSCARLANYLRNCSIAYKSERERILSNPRSRALTEVELENNRRFYMNEYSEIKMSEREQSYGEVKADNNAIFEIMVNKSANYIIENIARINGWLDNNVIKLQNPLYEQIKRNIYSGIRKDVSITSVTISNLEMQNIDVVLSETNLEVLESFSQLQKTIIASRSINQNVNQTQEILEAPSNNQKIKEIPIIDTFGDKAA